VPKSNVHKIQIILGEIADRNRKAVTIRLRSEGNGFSRAESEQSIFSPIFWIAQQSRK
jgi:hypothetical protein